MTKILLMWTADAITPYNCTVRNKEKDKRIVDS